VLRYADHWQLGSPFEQYVRERVSFCNTLVDRIVAGLPTDSANHWQQIGYEDRLLTACEPYHLWVLEAPGWVQTALPLAKAGLNVHFVANLEPYRTRKVRILNGAHSMLAPLGYLAGMLTVREAIANPLVAGFVRNALHNEVIPFLPGDAGELQQYAATTIERFGNPAIRHDLLAITLNSVAKYRTRLVPSALAYIKNKQFVPEHIAFAFAALIFFYRGLKAGAQIPIKDDPAIVEYFRQKWEITRYTQPSLENMVTDVMAQNEWWGTDLALFPFFVERIAHHLYLIDQIGVLDAIRELNEDVLA
jgi:tagaturonate reductase